MKIKFLGVGAAFTTMDYYQSNMLITAESGKKLLLDCGSDIRYSLGEADINAGNFSEQIDAIYISHLHSDHIGGLEWVAFNTYFNVNKSRPKLIIKAEMLDELWKNSLRGGLKCIEGKMMELEDYFECLPVDDANCFTWENISFTLMQMSHIVAEPEHHYSYGLLMAEAGGNQKVFITTDTQFAPGILDRISQETDLIFHDTETTPFRTTVHAHYEDLCKLPLEIREKTWLYHYQPKPDRNPVKDGFRGFVAKGQEFNLG